MHQPHEQLMQLLASRGLEWLRRHIMDLPDPCPDDHPDLSALGRAGQIAPALSGLRGRPSPLEVLVRRRLTPAMLRAASLRAMAGARDAAMLDLVQAGAMIAPDDPVWQIACEELAEDNDLPLTRRMALSAAPALIARAESTLTGADAGTTAAIMAHLWQYGAARPHLPGLRVLTAIHARLHDLLRHAAKQGNCADVARMIVAIALIEPDFDPGEYLSDLIGSQRPDGSFGPRIGFATEDQTFAQGIEPTLAVVHALHVIAWRRWNGPLPARPETQPFQSALARAGEEIAATLPGAIGPELAAALNRAGIWRTAPATLPLTDPARLARLCFGDAATARRYRHLCPGDPSPEGVWLAGRPVRLLGPLPPAFRAQWIRAAKGGDDGAFLFMAALARRHHDRPDHPALRRAGRRIAVQAMGAGDPLDRLERLILLASTFPAENAARQAA